MNTWTPASHVQAVSAEWTILGLVLGARGLPRNYSFGGGLCASLGYGGHQGSVPCLSVSVPSLHFPPRPHLCPVPESPQHSQEDADEVMKVHLDNPGCLPILRSLVGSKVLSQFVFLKQPQGSGYHLFLVHVWG